MVSRLHERRLAGVLAASALLGAAALLLRPAPIGLGHPRLVAVTPLAGPEGAM